MAGLSNACYRVHISDKALKNIEEHTLLYRKFENKTGNKTVEAVVFKSMSDNELGPKLYF